VGVLNSKKKKKKKKPSKNSLDSSNHYLITMDSTKQL
jgi:hypothetical protein